MSLFLLKVHSQRGQSAMSPTVEFDGDTEAARRRAEELLAPEGIAEVEVFQRIDNGRLIKRTAHTWAS